MQEVSVMKRHRSEEFAPLMLVMSGQKKNRLVRSLHDMAEALMLAWPSDDGEEYIVAVKTCLDALYGNRPVKDARAALIRAAEEAGILVIGVIP
ncbi:DUF982 domain-containing protein [Rhizobium grahamii]|uniref:DUF982 domain-containing protein n=1 Tax=Rhizobium grahamii TaxID=1120045 RepID=A0A370KGN1_9HYPH|nr:DUF982 domain-containing protein [Rhizobium grahamii]RDJ03891.1 hypothetical protein B5K06_28685 [Rhizobium grahamii]